MSDVPNPQPEDEARRLLEEAAKAHGDAQFEHQTPPIEQRSDLVSRTRLDLIQHAYVLWSRRSLIILTIILVIQLATAGVSLYLWNENKNRQEDNKQAASDLKNAIKSSEERQCQDRNARHDDGLVKLNLIIDKSVEAKQITPEGAVKARQQNTILISALVPKRDCAAEVKKLGLG